MTVLLDPATCALHRATALARSRGAVPSISHRLQREPPRDTAEQGAETSANNLHFKTHRRSGSEISRSVLWRERVEHARELRELRRSTVPDAARQIAQARAAFSRRCAEHAHTGAHRGASPHHPDNFRQSGHTTARTLSERRDDNRFITHAEQSSPKGADRDRVISDLDLLVATEHETMRVRDGFLSREHSPQARVTFEIFERVVAGYNRYAEMKGAPPFGGKLFLVDSAENNAFIFADHDDLYLNVGFLRDYSRYCEQRCGTFTEEDAAALIAHELGHVFQHSSFVGVTFAEQSGAAKETSRVEVLSLKRAAENDADLFAVHMLPYSGYSPARIISMLEFLRDTTESATVEESFSDHPHPKQRLTFIEDRLAQPRAVTPSWNLPLHPLQGFTDFPSERHLGPAVNTVMTSSKILELAERPDATPTQVLESARLLAERQGMATQVELTRHETLQGYFAKHLFRENLLLIARKLAEGAGVADPTYQPPQGANYGWHTVTTITDEEIRGVPTKTALTDSTLAELQRQDSSDADVFSRRLFEVADLVTRSSLPLTQKTHLLSTFRAMQELHSSKIDIVTFRRFEHKAPRVSLEETITRVAGGDLTALGTAEEIPYAVFHRFGATTLDSRYNVEKLLAGHSLAGLHPGRFSNTDVRLERESASLFSPHTALCDLGVDDGHATATRAVMVQWLADLKLEISPHIRGALKAVAPALQRSFETHGANDTAHAAELARATVSSLAGDWCPVELHEPLLWLLEKGLLPLPECCRSPVFEQEYGLSPPSFQALDLHAVGEKLIERSPDAVGRLGMSNIVEWILEQKASEEGLREVLSKFSAPMQERLLHGLVTRGTAIWGLDPIMIYRIARAHLGERSAERVLETMIDELGKSPRILQAMAERGDRIDRLAAFLDRYLDALPPYQRIVSDGFVDGYLQVHLTRAGKIPAPIPQAQAFEIIERISRHGTIHLSVALPTIDSEEGPRALRDEEMNLSFVQRGPGDSVSPLFIGDSFVQRDPGMFASLFIENSFTRTLFGMSRVELQKIAHNQSLLLASAENSQYRADGRVDELPILNRSFGSVLNALIVYRLLEELPGAVLPSPNPHSLAPIIQGNIEIRRAIGALSQTFIRVPADTEVAALAAQRVTTSSERIAFAAELKRGFLVANGVKGDELIGEVIKAEERSAPASRDVFLAFAPLLLDVQIPSLRLIPTATVTRTAYLEALAMNVSIDGLKTQLLGDLHGRGWFAFSVTTSEEREASFSLLTRLLPKPSLYRDAVIDTMERALLPELFQGSAARGGFPCSDSYWSSVYVRNMMIDTTTQWGTLGKIDTAGLGHERRTALLDLYARIIPLIANPDRKARCGAIALALWRSEYPAAVFTEERGAILRAFPDPSPLRDDALDSLMGRHVIGGRGVSAHEVGLARELYTSVQGMRYERDLTRANTLFQTLHAVLSAASREDRAATLCWLLNQERYPLPAPLAVIDDRLNVDFSELPSHVRYAPPSIRREILTTLLTGENGLLEVRSASDRKVRDQFIAAMLDEVLPDGDNVPAKSGLSRGGLAMTKEIFQVAFGHYPASLAAAMTMNILELVPDLRSLPIGRRVVRLAENFGPDGPKICQMLSEREDLIPHVGFRNELARAKHSGTPIPTLAVVDAFFLAGWNYHEIEIGPLRAKASMKQVHRGAVYLDGTWHDAAQKAVCPDLVRRAPHDTNARTAVVKYLRERYGKDFGAAAERLGAMITEESDLRGERASAERIRNTGAEVGLALRAPATLSRPGINQQFVLSDQYVRGIEIGELLAQRGKSPSEEHLRELASKRGLTTDEVRAIFALDIDMIVSDIGSRVGYAFTHPGETHADLHQSNVLVCVDGPRIIDTGLTASQTAAQAEASARIVRGVLLRAPDEVVAGVAQFVGIEPGECATLGSTVKSGTISARLKALSKAVLRIEGPQERLETLAKIIKARNQTLWLYPLSADRLPQTLQRLRAELTLSPAEERRLITANWMDAVQATVRSLAMGRMYNRAAALPSDLRGRVASAVKDLRAAVVENRLRSRLNRSLRSVRSTKGGDTHEGERRSPHSYQPGDGPSEVAPRALVAEIFSNGSTSPHEEGIGALLRNNSNLTREEIDYYAICHFTATSRVMAMNYELHLNVYELKSDPSDQVYSSRIPLIDAEVGFGFGGPLTGDEALLTYGLAAHLFRHRFPESPNAYPCFNNPELRFHCERACEAVLAWTKLGRKYGNFDAPIIDPAQEARLSREVTAGTSYKLDFSKKIEPFVEAPLRRAEVAQRPLPEFARWALRHAAALNRALSPGRVEWELLADSNHSVAIKLLRLQSREGGQTGLKIHDLRRGEVVTMKLSDSQIRHRKLREKPSRYVHERY